MSETTEKKPKSISGKAAAWVGIVAFSYLALVALGMVSRQVSELLYQVCNRCMPPLDMAPLSPTIASVLFLFAAIGIASVIGDLFEGVAEDIPERIAAIVRAIFWGLLVIISAGFAIGLALNVFSSNSTTGTSGGNMPTNASNARPSGNGTINMPSGNGSGGGSTNTTNGGRR